MEGGDRKAGVDFRVVRYYFLHFLCACIHQIISFVTDEWANFIVLDLPLENEIYTLFGKSALVRHI